MTITSDYGRIVTGQTEISTSVYSDGRGAVSSSTSRWNRFRVRWQGGKESYAHWKIDGEPGDVLIAVWKGKRCIAECNSATDQRHFYAAPFKPVLFIFALFAAFASWVGYLMLYSPVLQLVMVASLVIAGALIVTKFVATSRWRNDAGAEIDRLVATSEFQTFAQSKAQEAS